MTQKTVVYVLNKNGESLMPTNRCGRVRKLLKSGLAVPVCNCPFTIRLKYDVDNIRQSVYYGVDTGRENIGGAASDENGNCVHMSRLKTNNKFIKKHMQNRARCRRERRHNKRVRKQRKAMRNNTTIQNGNDDVVRTKKSCKSKEISYPGMEKTSTHKVIQGAESQFNNRTQKDGWLPPSGKQLIQMHVLMLENARKFLPITHVCLERVCFDFQKLENENIKAWEYSKGPMYGFKDYKDYVGARQGYRCLICGKQHIDEYHHIVPKSKGGTDRAGNIAGLCYDCHQSVIGVHKSKDAQENLLNLIGGRRNYYGVGLLNAIMPSLITCIREYCDRNKLAFVVTNGHETSSTRKSLGLDVNKTDKDGGHHVDAYCISLAGRNRPDMNNVHFPDVLHNQQRFKKKSKNNIHKLNQREYYFNGCIVAVNRHKATDQDEVALEEYMSKFTETHTGRELAQHLHELVVRPAKRDYTFHKYNQVAPIHAGDVVQYEKKNKSKGNVKRMVFIATRVSLGEEKVEHGTKSKKLKFCKRIKSGCIPYINTEKIELQMSFDCLQKVHN